MKTLTRPNSTAAPPAGGSQRWLLLGVGILIAAFLVFFPTKQLIDQRERINRLEGRLTILTAENARLAEEVSRLEDPEELELLARERLGMVRPGEQVYLFVPADPVGDEPDPSTEEPSVIRRWWSALVELIRGGDR